MENSTPAAEVESSSQNTSKLPCPFSYIFIPHKRFGKEPYIACSWKPFGGELGNMNWPGMCHCDEFEWCSQYRKTLYHQLLENFKTNGLSAIINQGNSVNNK